MSFQTMFATIFVLGVLVAVHEAGHFLVAKSVGIWCKTFSLGFGPKILRRRIGETEYALSAIPLGGYVKMAGEGFMEDVQDLGTGDLPQDLGPDGEEIPSDRFFSTKNTWQRMAVILAGPLMNLLIAVVICVGLVWVNGSPVPPESYVGRVEEGGAAEIAGLEPGDRIVAISGTSVGDFDEVWIAMQASVEANEIPFAVSFERDGVRVERELEPIFDEDGRWAVGLAPRQGTQVGKVRQDGPAANAGIETGDIITSVRGEEVAEYGDIARIINESTGEELEIRWRRGNDEMTALIVPEAFEVLAADGSVAEEVGRIYIEPYQAMRSVGFLEATRVGSRWSWVLVQRTANGFASLFRGRASMKSLSGPLRIAQISGEMARWGFDRLLTLMAFLSVNLFILNLLPIPVLDGGHAVFILYEMVLGKRPNQRAQMIATQAGMVFLLLVMAWVITQDFLHMAS
jgi:regulator of sigma E protease